MKDLITGAEALMRSLEHQGVTTIFGYPGGSIMPVFDALYDHQNILNHILVRHEQGAAHAAQGYARVSGDVGVCLVTSGPGATNTVTGIADAMIDSTPIVESVNWGKKMLHDGSTLHDRDAFIYGGALTLDVECYVADRIALLANLRERCLWGGDTRKFHTQFGVGIKFIINCNPSTGGKMVIPAKRQAKFRPGIL